jgi:hypothetical protein
MAKSFIFDNGFQQPVGQTSLSFNGGQSSGTAYRGWTTVDPSGGDAGNNAARYWHHDLLMCGAPNPRTDLSTTGQQGIMASGFAKTTQIA